MQSQNRFFDDLARVAAGAMGTLSGVRSEVETRPERRFVARLVVLRHGQNEQGHPRAYPNYSDAQGNVGEEVFRFCRVGRMSPGYDNRAKEAK